ncbi:MAG: ABC transporter ATP-binding protein [Candidatus Dactylopiibacterium sp.]|nr:ABC transporter ATP-binding protein [Candidatus Dactylopiibacterium sp.]
MSPILEFEALRQRWPGATRDGLDIPAFHLAPGEQLFLQGESGSGKSTLLSLAAGLITPTAGTVRLFGAAFSAHRARTRDRLRADHIGYLFQQFNLLPYLPVLDNVLLPCRFSARRAGRAGARPAHEARRLLDHLGLPESCWTRPARLLSIGQQQRVAAARALIGRPELLLADEPTSALDAVRQQDFLALLRAESNAAQSALIFVSHDERLAMAFDRRARLTDGHIEALA